MGTRGFMTDEYLHQATPLTSQALGGIPPYQTPTYGGSMTPKTQLGLGSTQGSGTQPMPTGGGPVAAASPAAPTDGKAFFRQARSRLPQESFNQFLASIKRLNNQQQTREETLGEARQLFGGQNEDLYFAFENLLNSQGVGGGM